MTSSKGDVLGNILQEIASDHAYLEQLVAQLEPDDGSEASRSEIGRVLAAMADYANEHFRREEYVMERLRYAGLAPHRQEHARLIDQLSALVLGFERGEVDVVGRTQALMQDWATRHITGPDQQLLAFIMRCYSEMA